MDSFWNNSVSVNDEFFSFNILLSETILIVLSILKGIKTYNNETKELRELFITDNENINHDINEKEKCLYNVNQRIKLTERQIDAKKQEIRYLTNNKNNLSSETNNDNIAIVPVIGSRVL